MTIWMPVEPEDNELLNNSPLALLIGMLLDQQVPLDRATRTRSASSGRTSRP